MAKYSRHVEDSCERCEQHIQFLQIFFRIFLNFEQNIILPSYFPHPKLLLQLWAKFNNFYFYLILAKNQN